MLRHRFYCLTLILAQSAFALHSGEPVQLATRPQPQKPLRTVTGEIENSVTHAPISGATVHVWCGYDLSAVSGADGRFQIDTVPEGEFAIDASKPGFIDEFSLAASHSEQPAHRLLYTVGAGRNDFLIALVPAGRIVGRVRSKEGAPVRGAVVRLLKANFQEGHKHWVTAQTVSADSEGNYEISDPSPGECVVFAAGNPQQTAASSAPASAIAPGYFGGADSFASAKVIQLRAGREFRADVQLNEKRGYRVSLKIMGMPTNMGSLFSVLNPSGEALLERFLGSAEAAAQPVVQVLPEGDYTVRIWANQGIERTYEARQPIKVRADSRDFEITVHQVLFTSIPISVIHANSPAEDDVNEKFRRAFKSKGAPDLSLSQIDKKGLLPWGPLRPDERVVVRGDPPILTFGAVLFGKYRLHVENTGKECLASASYGNMDVTHDYLIVSEARKGPPLTLNMSYDCATLTATLRTRSKEQAFMVVVPVSSGVSDAQMLPLGSESLGSSTLRLAPGTYRVFAFSNLLGLEYANADVLRSFSGETVTLKSGQSTEVALELNQRND